MAGHSKWSNIKHRKAAQDARKGKIFTKLIRELFVAAREGGGEPEDNPRLRTAVDKALFNNMKKDTVERAIERGAGNAGDEDYEELVYEGYGPGGMAVYVEAMTDNKTARSPTFAMPSASSVATWGRTARSASCSTAREH